MTQMIQMFGLKLLSGKKDDMWNFIKRKLDSNEKVWVVTLNALMFLEYFKNDEYKYELQNSTISIPDGIGVVKYLEKWGYHTERCPGIDTMLKICEWQNHKIFLLGSKPGIPEKAKEHLEKKFPNISIVGTHHGYFDDDSEVINLINNSGAEILFVGMGVPRQEEFIYKNLHKLNVKMAMGVGGSIDVISGKISRAPKLFQIFGLEWLYRMLREPKRFKKFPDLMNFYFKVYRSKETPINLEVINL
ncbi:WecB/TagA/CpsF family glycosyltransferase [Marinitoga litoralis]|uniref:WecB/TagA/CpsF family glycosyltransferase n=1 Tax=Marinitoga litoralis TaxID=570855 RepID=UPI0019615F01|nr:WecB/TagA/CpsF family glycosyltransferase [Marinitoga litoralis]MBM7560219.1 N-acetylglucosaminyldiphosphoundecaprenol N-acetyl-beta-D-mannosaminyltransferase [Marinitoga litoralis]